MPMDLPPEAMVPAWALQLSTAMGEIRAKVESIPAIQQEVMSLRKEMVPMREHEVLTGRSDELWNGYQQMKGAMRIFVFIQGGINVGALVWGALRQTGHI